MKRIEACVEVLSYRTTLHEKAQNGKKLKKRILSEASVILQGNGSIEEASVYCQNQLKEFSKN